LLTLSPEYLADIIANQKEKVELNEKPFRENDCGNKYRNFTYNEIPALFSDLLSTGRPMKNRF
jgi:hypothetical protein